MKSSQSDQGEIAETPRAQPLGSHQGTLAAATTQDNAP
jgi:hypothetical protein